MIQLTNLLRKKTEASFVKDNAKTSNIIRFNYESAIFS